MAVHNVNATFYTKAHYTDLEPLDISSLFPVGGRGVGEPTQDSDPYPISTLSLCIH